MHVKLTSVAIFSEDGILSGNTVAREELWGAMEMGSEFADAMEEAATRLYTARQKALRTLLGAPAGSGEAMLEAMRDEVRRAEIAYRIITSLRWSLTAELPE